MRARCENGLPPIGCRSGWLRRRSSMGSTPIPCANSSTALSSAKEPMASPGARMKVFGTMSRSTCRWTISKLLARYMPRVPAVYCSGQAPCGGMIEKPVCTSAVKWPSPSAPSATRCSVGLRPPTMRYTPSRLSIKRSGRPASFAAATATTWWSHKPLPPKPPPTNGDKTRTCPFFRPKSLASAPALGATICVASWTSSSPSVQATVRAWSSMALWF